MQNTLVTKLPRNVTLKAVISIAKGAGRIALDHSHNGTLNIQEKSPQDRVTVADIASENHIRQSLYQLNPNIGFMGEESGTTPTISRKNTEFLWIVDPIDGTENFIRGIDHWSISIALTRNEKPVLGVVYLPFQDQCYSAVTGQKAYKNGKIITTSAIKTAEQALIGMGVSNRIDFKTDYLDVLEHLHQQGLEHRRFGSAAYSLCQVAEGIIEGYIEKHLNPWDAAAGVLIAKEAGAYVGDIDLSDPGGAPVYVIVPALKEIVTRLC